MSSELLSIILPVYQCSDCLIPLHTRLHNVLTEMPGDFELIFVDDGATDNSWEILRQLAERDIHMRAYRLKRNYGQHAAIATGLELATGDRALVMDADLQDPPELVPEFVREAESGADIVLSVRRRRSETLFRILASRVVRGIMPIYRRLPKGQQYGTFSLISRRAINEYLKDPDRRFFYLKILDRLSFPVAFLEYDQDGRYAGKSSYRLSKLFKVLANVLEPSFWSRCFLFLAAVASLLIVSIVTSRFNGTTATLETAAIATLSFLVWLAALFCKGMESGQSRSGTAPAVEITDRLIPTGSASKKQLQNAC